MPVQINLLKKEKKKYISDNSDYYYYLHTQGSLYYITLYFKNCL